MFPTARQTKEDSKNPFDEENEQNCGHDSVQDFKVEKQKKLKKIKIKGNKRNVANLHNNAWQ